MVSWKHKIDKKLKKCKNRKPLYWQGSKGYSFWDKNWKLISFWNYIRYPENTTKNQLSHDVFCAKYDERENCQQGKVLSSSPIRIGQFQKMSFLKAQKIRQNPTGNGKHVLAWPVGSLQNFLKIFAKVSDKRSAENSITIFDQISKNIVLSFVSTISIFQQLFHRFVCRVFRQSIWPASFLQNID